MPTPEDIDLAGLMIRAVSIAGITTCIQVPSWKLCFDIGKAPHSAARLPRVFFTHGHVDHVGGIAHHCGTRTMQNLSPAQYWIGAEYAEALEGLMTAFRAVDHSELPCTIQAVVPGDCITLSKNKRVRVFRSMHRVPTVGYALEGDRERLLPHLDGVPGPEIAAARARGEAITSSETVVELVFCGDTTIKVVEREAIVRTAKRLVLECTFLDDAITPERARKTGHVHLDDLCEHAELFENEAILLTHFSHRYGAQQIVDTLRRRLPASLQGRVTPLLAGFR